MTDLSTERPVMLPARSRQGLVLGLDAWQAITLVLAGVVILLASNGFGPLGFLYAAPIYLPLGAVAVAKRHNMSLPRWVAIWMMKRIRGAVKLTNQVYRPEEVRRVGVLNLPGRLATVQLWEADGIATVYDAHARTVTVVAELEVPGFMMKDLEERLELAERWSQVLASLTQREGIKRVSLQERTHPMSIEEARQRFAQTRVENVNVDAARANYAAVLDKSEAYPVAHRNYLSLTLDLVALATQVKALGGDKNAIQSVAAIEAGNVSDALKGAEVTVKRWLNSRQLAALPRTLFDPEAATMIEARSGENEGVDPAAMGPMIFEEPRKNDAVVRTDSGVHSTMWIHEWPRSAAPVGFVSDIVFARHPVSGEAVSHVLTIVMTPTPVPKALKRIREQKKTWRANARLRAKRGDEENAFDDADYVALERQEQELVAGHGEFQYGAYLTVTGRDEEHLEQAVAGMRNALSRQGMEAQTLYAQQGEALLVSALPIGLGVR